jgi:hypothetical protein
VNSIVSKPGSKDIDLLVHSYYVGRPSPCVVIEDWVNKGLIGGAIDGIGQIFQLEIAKHPGYTVTARQDLIAVMNDTEPESEPAKDKE